MEFCKAFNASTQKLGAGYADSSCYNSIIKIKVLVLKQKSPPVSFFIKKALKLKKASKTPGKEFIASISKNDIKKIAESKMEDLNTDSIESVESMVSGTARSMGIKVE